MSDDVTLDLAQDLREIRRLAAELETEAAYRADDKDQPGGEAMTYLGPVANLTAWENRIDTALRKWFAMGSPKHAEPFTDTDDTEPPLQLLEFWTEMFRFDFDAELDHTTLDTEAAWLTDNLTTLHAVYRDARWDLFTKDVHRARTSLEAILKEGERTTYGVQCPQCHSHALVRTTEPRLHRPCTGHQRGWCHWPKRACCDRGGLQETWECPGCLKRLNLSEYESAVMRDYISVAPWLPAEYVERRTNTKPGTVKVWATRGHVRTRKDEQGRTVYNVEDIDARHADSDDAA